MTKKTSVIPVAGLDPDLYRRVKAIAALKKVKIGDVINDGMWLVCQQYKENSTSGVSIINVELPRSFVDKAKIEADKAGKTVTEYLEDKVIAEMDSEK